MLKRTLFPRQWGGGIPTWRPLGDHLRFSAHDIAAFYDDSRVTMEGDPEQGLNGVLELGQMGCHVGVDDRGLC